VSGIIIPPIVFSSAGAGSTNTLSANGFNDTDILFILFLNFKMMKTKLFQVLQTHHCTNCAIAGKLKIWHKNRNA
jgi:hypothetical protein